MPETPIEVLHLPGRLRADFTGKLPEATSGTADQREANFLSRALAAFAVQKLAVCTSDEAAAAIVDGGQDGGIDAIYFAATTHILWVAQSKFHRDGTGEPGLGDVTKFKTGLENLLQGKWEVFQGNAAWARMIPQLVPVFNDRSLVVRAVLVYSGIHLVSEDRRRLFEDLRTRFSPDDDYFQIQFCNLTTVHDWMTGADATPGVAEIEFTLRKPGWVKDPYETIYGLLPLTDLAKLHLDHGRKLIAANIRAYKGDTLVNEQIAATAREEPQHFFYLNNGLTAYCERFEINHLDRGNTEEKRVKAFGFSIVNGAQTLGSVADSLANSRGTPPEGFAFLKVISLERCEDDRTFAGRITRSTNFQNQIGPRDFVALDPQQQYIENQLILSGISYYYKDGIDVPSPDASNFTLDEATTACASLVQTNDCDFCARLLANRKSLWSFDVVYPEAAIYRSRYSHVFRSDRSARTVWRAVQTQRVALSALKTTETGVRKDFFENGRWLIMNLVFLRLHPQNGDNLALTTDEMAGITQAIQEYAEVLWTVCQAKGFVSAKAGGGWETPRHFRSVFSAPGDCALLRGAVLASLATNHAPQANPDAGGA